ncbi:MAG: hypothetical protein GY772_23220, partial [bacterium]|nr:hypothetical protein [bacterium]
CGCFGRAEWARASCGCVGRRVEAAVAAVEDAGQVGGCGHGAELRHWLFSIALSAACPPFGCFGPWRCFGREEGRWQAAAQGRAEHKKEK